MCGKTQKQTNEDLEDDVYGGGGGGGGSHLNSCFSLLVYYLSESLDPFETNIV